MFKKILKIMVWRRIKNKFSSRKEWGEYDPETDGSIVSAIMNGEIIEEDGKLDEHGKENSEKDQKTKSD